ncbi:hypothetical protein KI387_009699, partial [Taxus chinensis]
VNKDTELEIQQTREIESKIVLCFEKEKVLLRKGDELMNIVNSKEFKLNNLMAVFDVSKKELDTTKEILALEEKSRNEIVLKIGGDREDFINLCRKFQWHFETAKRAQAYKKLLLKRKYLGERIIFLEKEMKGCCVEEEVNDWKWNSYVYGVQDVIYNSNYEGEKLLKDIDGLKTALHDINDFEDSF